MGFRKIRHNTGEEIFKVKIEDTSGATIENWVFMKSDFGQWVNMIERKFGIRKKSFGNLDRDLDWAV